MQVILCRRWRLALCGIVTLAGLVWGAIALGGCGGGGGGGGGTTPPPGLTDELIAAIENDSEEITALAQAAGPANYEQVAVQAERLGTVEWAQADGGTLTVRYRNAGLESWVSAPDWVEPDVWPTVGGRAPSAAPVNPAELVGGRKAMLINSVADDPGFSEVPALMRQSEHLLQAMGYEVERIDGSACTIEKMKQLTGASVVGFCGHGTRLTSSVALVVRHIGLQTGQDWGAVSLRRYAADWFADRVTVMNVPWGDGTREQRKANYRRMAAVTNIFFSHYYSQPNAKLSRALFYCGSCMGLRDDTLANALLGAGASAYVGWTETQRIGPWAMLQLFRSMQSGMDLEHAMGTLGPGLSTDDFYHEDRRRQVHAVLQYRPTSGGTLQLSLPGRNVDPFRVTLTWQAQNDIDLHVFARPSSHSYYANKAITIGALDVDDVDGYGPEHFTADQRIAGTYYVAANYYSDRGTSAATPTYVQVETASTVKSYGPYTLQTENFNSGYPVRGSTNSWWRVCDIHVLSNGSVDVRSPDTSIPLGNYGYGGTYGVRHSAAGPRKDYEAIPVGIDPSLRPFMVPEGASR